MASYVDAAKAGETPTRDEIIARAGALIPVCVRTRPSSIGTAP